MQWFSDSEHEPFHLEAGPTAVLLLHGFMGTPAEMRPLGEALARVGISSQAIALPGFGPDLAALGRTRRQDWVATAVRAWDELSRRYQQASVLGFSMGGSIALHVATARRPDRLVLLAPLWRVASGDPRIKLLPIVKHVVRSIRPFQDADFSDSDLRQFFGAARPGLDLDDPNVQRTLRQEIQLPTAALDELRKLAGAAPRLAGQVAVPTLIVQGDTDTTVLVRDTRELSGFFNGHARLEEIAGDHLIVWDNRPSWSTVEDLVVNFMQGTTS